MSTANMQGVVGDSWIDILADALGRLVISPTAGASSSFSTAGQPNGLEDELIVKATAGTLVSVFGYNNAAAVRYVHIFDDIAPPADGEVPSFPPFRIGPGTSFSLAIPYGGFTTLKGIVLVSSTTAVTKTLTGAADMHWWGRFE